MSTWAAVAVFGALGALARYGLDLGITRLWPTRFPVGTFAVNVVGSFALGVVFAIVEAHPPQTMWLRPGLGAGFLGAFTTFSTFSLQTLLLWESGDAGLAALYAGASLAAGLLAVWAGLTLGRAW
jgi:CrcB protein